MQIFIYRMIFTNQFARIFKDEQLLRGNTIGFQYVAHELKFN